VEVLVVISVTALLTGVSIFYNRTSQKQITLFKEQAKIINTVLRAKSLALTTYTKEGAPCAYGIHFNKDAREMRIFRDLDASGTTDDCATADNQYEATPPPNAEDLDPPAVEILSGEISFIEPFNLTDIVFIPPQPEVVIIPDPSPATDVAIEIGTADGVSKLIKINSFGQVTAQ